MSGGGTEQSLSNTDYPWSLTIRSDPEFCLRDFEATHIIDGRVKLEVFWTKLPRGSM